MNALTLLKSRVVNWLMEGRLPLLPEGGYGYQHGGEDWSTELAIQQGVEANTWVYACVQTICDAVSSVGWVVEEYDDDEKVWLANPDHPLQTLLDYPNRFMDRQHVMDCLVMNLELGGNGFAHIVKGRDGEPLEIWPLAVDSIKPVPDPKRYIKAYRYQWGGNEYLLDPQEVIHVLYPNPSDPYWGLAPLRAAANAVNTDVAAMAWNRYALSNRSTASTVVAFKAPLTKQQWLQAREQLADCIGPENAHRPWVLGGDVDVKSLTKNAVELDYMNGRKMGREEIAAAFRVPLPLVGDLGHAILNNVMALERVFWRGKVIPLLHRISMVYNRSLASYWDPRILALTQRPGLRCRPDFANVAALLTHYAELVTVGEAMVRMGIPVQIVNQRLGLGLPADELAKVPALPYSGANAIPPTQPSQPSQGMGPATGVDVGAGATGGGRPAVSPEMKALWRSLYERV